MTDRHARLNIRTYHPADQAAVIALWHACGLVVPQNDPADDIAHKLTVQPELFLVADYRERLAATVMAGYDGHRGWINYLAVQPELRLAGVGRRIMGVAEDKLRALGCPKINLQVRESNAGVITFYKRLGFTVDPVVSLGKRLL